MGPYSGVLQYENVLRLFACISIVMGAVECFAGFKIMKVMMAIWSFFIGAMVGVLIGIATNNVAFGVTMVIICGAALAILSFKLYIAGIFILMSFLTYTTIYIICDNVYISLIVSVIVGVLAIYFVKPVIITTTAVSGAGIILSSAYQIMQLKTDDNHVIMILLWIPIALAGIVVQSITTKKIKGVQFDINLPFRSKEESKSFSERKYPGMQRAYRNFCIKCGYELLGTKGDKCPRCGHVYDN